MDVKIAVATAKSYVNDLFGPEGIEGLRLEEVDRDEQNNWLVTVSFFRPPPVRSFAASLGIEPTRSYKVVQISPTAEVRSVTDRQLTAA
jgi:hypothetical protein